MLWTPADREMIPVHSPQELAVHVSASRAYAQAARVHAPSPDGREASVTSLGDDGWLVKVRDTSMEKGGWPCSQTITRLLDDGSFPTAFSGSQWYAPDETTDLAGCVIFAEQIHFDPAFVARAVWAWLAGDPLPAGNVATKASRDLVVCATVAEALAWIADAAEAPWPDEAAEATIEFASELAVDRVVVTSPGQIAVRVNGSARRVRFQCRTRVDNAGVRVAGMTDDLGHDYTMSLPERQILRVSRQRSRR
jgi:hypothetical protein